MCTRLLAPIFSACLTTLVWPPLAQAADDQGAPQSTGTKADGQSTTGQSAQAASQPVPSGSAPVTDSSPDSTRLARQFGLRLALKEYGPDEPWRLWIRNEGVDPVVLAADSKLLFLEVEVPGKKDAVTCMLPSGMREGLEQRVVELAPGEAIFRHIDPRFYCFSEGDQNVLVPGAIVKPHYGWPDESKTSWKQGKRVTEVLPPAPPFVAIPHPAPADDSDPAADTDPEAAAPAEPAPTDAIADGPTPAVPESTSPPDAPVAGANPTPAAVLGVRHLEGRAVALGSAYAVWSAASLHERTSAPLRVRVIKGSDSETERNVTVTVGISNQTDSPLHLFLRRELLSFEVLGPTGDAKCRPEEDLREPEKQSFTTLRPHEQTTLSSRLVELCPRGTFLEPGLYLVTATLHAKYDGQRFNLHAFVGDSEADAPKPVRVRVREEPFITPAPLQVPAAPGAAPAAPAPPPTPPAG